MLNSCVIDAEVYDYCDNEGPTIFQSVVHGSFFFRGEMGGNCQQGFEQ